MRFKNKDEARAVLRFIKSLRKEEYGTEHDRYWEWDKLASRVEAQAKRKLEK